MLHKAGKPEDLVGSYRPLSLTSCLGKLLEKAVADNLSNWESPTKSSINNKMILGKTGAQMIIYLNFLKQLNLVSVKATQLQESSLMSKKPSTKYGLMGFFIS